MTPPETVNPVRFEVAVRCPKCGKEAVCFPGGMFQKIETVVSCKSCAYRKPHVVNWPTDAFYQTEVCNDVIWGWNRGHFTSVRDHIASKERNLRQVVEYGWAHGRIPAHFLEAKRREAVVRAIDHVLKKS
jgi:hypothetical protein